MIMIGVQNISSMMIVLSTGIPNLTIAPTTVSPIESTVYKTVMEIMAIMDVMKLAKIHKIAA